MGLASPVWKNLDIAKVLTQQSAAHSDSYLVTIELEEKVPGKRKVRGLSMRIELCSVRWHELNSSAVWRDPTGC